MRRFVSLLFITLSFQGIQASVTRRIALAAASIAVTAPMLKESYNNHKLYNELHKKDNFSLNNGFDPEIENVIREHWRQQGYKNVNTIPIAAIEDHGTLAMHQDIGMSCSYEYEDRIKKILAKDKLNDNDKETLNCFLFALDHEVCHLNSKHKKQLNWVETVVPITQEVISWPLLYKAAQKSNKRFVLMLAAITALKFAGNKYFPLVFKRIQEIDADKWAVMKNNDVNVLNSVRNHRIGIVIQALFYLSQDKNVTGTSRSIAFNALGKIFKIPRIEMDEDRYEKDELYRIECDEKTIKHSKTIYDLFCKQRLQWPLRLLSYVYDPEHAFSLDIANEIDRKLDKISSCDQP